MKQFNAQKSVKIICKFHLISSFPVLPVSIIKFVDGWELNGEYFPNINDHELPLEQRVYEFCDKTTANPFTRKALRKRKFISNQNGAVFQYKIPYQGSFAISVRYVHNPKRKFFNSKNFLFISQKKILFPS